MLIYDFNLMESEGLTGAVSALPISPEPVISIAVARPFLAGTGKRPINNKILSRLEEDTNALETRVLPGTLLGVRIMN